MTTFSDITALRATGYVPKAKYVEKTSGWQKLRLWIHETLEGKEGE
jgi:hypothetical protein